MIASRVFESIPPYMDIMRSWPVNPSDAMTSESHFWVARYSVKRMTRSSVHWPSGRMCSFSQAINWRAFESFCEQARSAQARIFLIRASSSSLGSENSRVAASTASPVASSYSSSSA